MGWWWTLKGFKGSELLLVTRHTTVASKDIELAVWRVRGKRGDASHVEVIDHEHGKTEIVWLV